MKKLLLLLTLAISLAASPGKAATVNFTDNFSTNPLQNGWQTYGDTNLFQWDSTNDVMDVTWDSSQGNSYFYHPLGLTVTRYDDFSLSFDLQLTTAEASGYGFQLAIGFLNFAEATDADFLRWSGYNSPDLVEFDYFPDVGYGATVWPLFVDTNSDFNWNGSSDYAIYAPNLGDWYHVVMTYTASNQVMVTTMTNFEQTSGVTIVDPLDPEFTLFNVDTLSISSYQDDGMGDSIYAQGMVGNFAVTICQPPLENATAMNNTPGVIQFGGQTNWLYSLQRTVDFNSWTTISTAVPGTGTQMTLFDPNPPPVKAFYRVKATSP